MKTLTALCLGALLWLPSLAKADPLNISVSILPQKYFVEKIAGSHANVQVMVPPGASPATYEPKPQQMIGLAKTDIYFSIGVPFEAAWLSKFQASNPAMDLIKTDQFIRKIKMESHHHHDDDNKHLENHTHEDEGEDHASDHDIIRDPHIWLSPKLVRLQSDSIRDGLIEHDPDNAQEYRQNHAALVREIHQTDLKLLEIFAQQTKPISFFIFHPSWGYFAKDYGLTQNALEIEGKSPTPKDLAQAIEIARKEHISVIFAQPEFSQKTAQTFANAIHGKVVRLSPLAYNWSDNLFQAAKAFVTPQDNPTP